MRLVKVGQIRPPVDKVWRSYYYGLSDYTFDLDDRNSFGAIFPEDDYYERQERTRQ